MEIWDEITGKIEREKEAIAHAIKETKEDMDRIKTLLVKRAEGFLVDHGT